jgi:hypothetical protein
MSIKSSTLSGYSYEPWFVEPNYYDVMSYPCEWTIEGLLPDIRIRQLNQYFYSRCWGKSKVSNFPTLFFKENLQDKFNEDLVLCIKEVMKDPNLSVFSSDSLLQLQEGRMKEIAKEHRKSIVGYVACPLIPSEIEAVKIYKINLGAPYSLFDSVKKLEFLRNS